MVKRKYNKKYNSDKCKKYYQKNKEQILNRQKSYSVKRYKDDEEFRLKQLVRAYTLNRYKKIKCNKCGTKENLQFHHWIYRLPVEENDFVVLCKKHHGEIHDYL